jgi:hypothetical protein
MPRLIAERSIGTHRRASARDPVGHQDFAEGDCVRKADCRDGLLRRGQDHEQERPDAAGPRRGGPAGRLRIRIHAGLDLPSAHPREADGRRCQLSRGGALHAKRVLRRTETDQLADGQDNQSRDGCGQRDFNSGERHRQELTTGARALGDSEKREVLLPREVEAASARHTRLYTLQTFRRSLGCIGIDLKKCGFFRCQWRETSA